MQDQVTKFTARGLKAAFVGGGQEERAIYDSVINGDMCISVQNHTLQLLLLLYGYYL